MGKHEYFACPLCGMNKSVRSAKREKKEHPRPEELQWPDINLETYLILQMREGGGKKAGPSGKTGKGKAPGSGFHTIPSESLTFAEVIKNPEYENIIQGMKEQLLRLLKTAKETGFIKESDLR
jgi:hypothetical protein